MSTAAQHHRVFVPYNSLTQHASTVRNTVLPSTCVCRVTSTQTICTLNHGRIHAAAAAGGARGCGRHGC
jgi:hypothetical protein